MHRASKWRRKFVFLFMFWESRRIREVLQNIKKKNFKSVRKLMLLMNSVSICWNSNKPQCWKEKKNTENIIIFHPITYARKAHSKVSWIFSLIINIRKYTQKKQQFLNNNKKIYIFKLHLMTIYCKFNW